MILRDDDLRSLLEPFTFVVSRSVKVIQEYFQAVKALEDVGWLIYYSVPSQQIIEYRGDIVHLNIYLEQYYHSNWNTIFEGIKLRIPNYYRVDIEAEKIVYEVLSAHEAGHYRSIPRLLFPEIERLICYGVSSRKTLVKLFKGEIVSDSLFKNLFKYITFTQFMRHVYKSGTLDDFRENPVPNRQASIHELMSYSIHNSSMKMSILTDFIFQILLPLKNNNGNK